MTTHRWRDGLATEHDQFPADAYRRASPSCACPGTYLPVMLTLILALIIIFIAAGIIGVVVHGLFWLFIIAVILFLATLVMGAVDKIKNKLQGAKGQAKEQTGKATGDESLAAEGKSDQTAGSLKQAGENIKDIFKK